MPNGPLKEKFKLKWKKDMKTAKISYGCISDAVVAVGVGEWVCVWAGET